MEKEILIRSKRRKESHAGYAQGETRQDTHTNQTNKDKTQRKNIISNNGKATSNIQGKTHMFNS